MHRPRGDAERDGELRVYALYAYLPGSAAIRGTIWGVVLWFVAQTVVMPMMGAGLFSCEMGGAIAARGSLIGHVLYGSLLGIIAGAPEPRVVAHASRTVLWSAPDPHRQ